MRQTKSVSVRLSYDNYERLHDIATQNDETVSSLMRLLIAKHLFALEGEVVENHIEQELKRMS